MALEVEGRQGEQPGGSAETREVKLVSVPSAEGRDEEGTPVRDPGSVSDSAAIEGAAMHGTDRELSPFAQRVAREARRRGFEHARRGIVLGDGAPWNRNLVEEPFPGAFEIVDIDHAKGHLRAVAIYAPGTELDEQRARQRRNQLDEGRIDDILAALKQNAASQPEARTCLDHVQRYRMRYPEARAQGICMASGVVEEGCKVVIATRLERARLHRTIAGADAIIVPRCARLSGRFERIWQRRASTQTTSATVAWCAHLTSGSYTRAASGASPPPGSSGSGPARRRGEAP